MCWLRGRNELMLHLRTPPFAQLYIFWGTGGWFVTHLLQRSSKFSIFPALVFLFLHTWIWLLATMMQSIAQSTSGAGWGLSILRTFSVQRPKPYTHVISTATIQLHLWVLLAAPWAGGCCRGWLQLHSGWIFPVLNDSEGRNCSCLTMANVLASSWTHVPNISMFSR